LSCLLIQLVINLNKKREWKIKQKNITHFTFSYFSHTLSATKQTKGSRKLEVLFRSVKYLFATEKRALVSEVSTSKTSSLYKKRPNSMQTIRPHMISTHMMLPQLFGSSECWLRQEMSKTKCYNSKERSRREITNISFLLFSGKTFSENAFFFKKKKKKISILFSFGR
jgi:hypothetical protein